MVHRDLKPDNVFIVPGAGGPLLKLIDFGIAKLRASTEFQKGLTRAGVIMGTPEYMAPEQLFAAENVDHRADLYSLGVILFEMLTGRRPADGDDVEQIVAAVVSGNVRHLADLEPRLAPGLVAVVERALRPDREAALRLRRSRCGSALAPFAGALSHVGRSPMSSEPAPHLASANAPRQTGPAQAFEVVPSVPKTLPPDGDSAMLADKGGTQEVSDEAVREALRASALPGNLPAYGYSPGAPGYGPPPAAYGSRRIRSPPVAYGSRPAARKGRSRTGLWIGLSLLIVLGLGRRGVGGGVLPAAPTRHERPTAGARSADPRDHRQPTDRRGPADAGRHEPTGHRSARQSPQSPNRHPDDRSDRGPSDRRGHTGRH